MPLSSKAETGDVKSLKLQVLRSRSLKRVLYIECGKDFVDILLSFLIMPIGSVLKLLQDASLVSTIDKGLFRLYASVNNLETTSFSVDKTFLVNPPSSASAPQNFLLITSTSSMTHECINPNCTNITLHEKQLCSDCDYVYVFHCSYCSLKSEWRPIPETKKCSNCDDEDYYEDYENYHFDEENTKLRAFRKQSNLGEVAPGSVPSTQNGGTTTGGFVKENITFIIKEDLTVVKSSTISSVALLQEMKIANFQDLDMKDVFIGRGEGLRLVRAAFVSAKPLTDVFEHHFTRGSAVPLDERASEE